MLMLALDVLFPDADLADLSHSPELWRLFEKHGSESSDPGLAELPGLRADDSKHRADRLARHQAPPFSKGRDDKVSLQIARRRVSSIRKPLTSSDER